MRNFIIGTTASPKICCFASGLLQFLHGKLLYQIRNGPLDFVSAKHQVKEIQASAERLLTEIDPAKKSRRLKFSIEFMFSAPTTVCCTRLQPPKRFALRRQRVKPGAVGSENSAPFHSGNSEPSGSSRKG